MGLLTYGKWEEQSGQEPSGLLPPKEATLGVQTEGQVHNDPH